MMAGGFAAVMAAGALLDGLWALYIGWVASGYPLRSGAVAGLLALVAGCLTLAYTKEPAYLAAWALGAAGGTAVTVAWRGAKRRG